MTSHASGFKRDPFVTLTLRRRRPDSTAGLTPLPVWQAMVLVVWFAGLLLLVLVRSKGGTA